MDAQPTTQLTRTAAIRIALPSTAGPLAALDTATPDPLGTVLLVPGYTGSKEDFVPLLDPLSDSGFRAVAYDQPGQFESPGPADEGAYDPMTLGAVCADLARDLAADGPVVLLGHSYGGLVARAAVLQGAPIAGLILLASGPGKFRQGDRFDALVAGDPLLRQHGPAAVYDATAARDEARRGAVPAELARWLRRRFLASSPAGLLGMGAALRTEPDRVADLAAALTAEGAGVAVVTGRADDAWSLDEQDDMATRLGTSLVIIEDAAHSPAIENPAAVLDVLLPLLHRWCPADS